MSVSLSHQDFSVPFCQTVGYITLQRLSIFPPLLSVAGSTISANSTTTEGTRATGQGCWPRQEGMGVGWQAHHSHPGSPGTRCGGGQGCPQLAPRCPGPGQAGCWGRPRGVPQAGSWGPGCLPKTAAPGRWLGCGRNQEGSAWRCPDFLQHSLMGGPVSPGSMPSPSSFLSQFMNPGCWLEFSTGHMLKRA